ncbi:MAG: glycosyltransferase [Bacteroidales bacterium]|nr:glycosyltransferase [Bacteroidales bacterium]
MPKVSVIIPVYNVEFCISKCAESLFQQTIDDIEYLFVNDKSTDNSLEVLNSIVEKYPHRKSQVKIINMDFNSGQAIVRAIGMQNITGEYFIHCDSDDWVDVRMYETMYNKAKECCCDIVSCDYYISNGTNHNIVYQNISDNGLFDDMLRHKAHWSLCNKLVKTSILKENKLIYPTGNMGEDMAIMIQLSYYSCREVHINEAFYYYYTNINSITKFSSYDSNIKKYDHSSRNVDLVCNFLEEKKLHIKYKDSIVWLKFTSKWYLAPLVYDSIIYKKWRQAYQEINPLIFSSSIITIANKIGYLLTYLRIYPFFLK